MLNQTQVLSDTSYRLFKKKTIHRISNFQYNKPNSRQKLHIINPALLIPVLQIPHNLLFLPLLLSYLGADALSEIYLCF